MIRITNNLIAILLFLTLVPTSTQALEDNETVVRAGITEFHAVWDGCAVNIDYKSGTHPTINQNCGPRMKHLNSEHVEHTRMICSTLLAAHTANKEVSLGFSKDPSVCDCGCPIYWATMHK